MTPADSADRLTLQQLLDRGALYDALTLARSMIDTGQGGKDVLELAAMLSIRTGDTAGAVDALEKFVAVAPDDPIARLNLAQALLQSARFDQVDPVLAPLPPSPQRDRIAGFAALQLGQLAEARHLFGRVLEAVPADAETHGNFASASLALGDHAAAIRHLEHAVTLQPRQLRFYLALVTALEQADMLSPRRKVARDAVQVQPDNPEAWHALGLAEAALSQTSAAEQALRRAIALAPARAPVYIDLGLLLEHQNKLDALETLALSAREQIGPEARFLEALSAFRRKTFDQAAALAESLPTTLPALRVAHLRGEIADRCGAPQEAFSWFTAMNNAALASTPPPPPGPSYREKVAADRAAFAACETRPRGSDLRTDSPVFIVGFPRSGTTLLDTMLGGLPDTTVLEERPYLSVIERDIGSMDRIMSMDALGIEDARTRYSAMLADDLPSARGNRIIDKNPLHMARLPLIDQLFPGAPILFVERHPYDVVLSCYVSNFRLNHAMRSFVDLEEAARTYDAVFTFAMDVERRLDLRVHRVRYERLVNDPENEIRAALRFIDAPFAPEMLDNVAAARRRNDIATASYAQVTERLYARSVGRWTRYRDQLAPVLPILAPWVERMGYEDR